MELKDLKTKLNDLKSLLDETNNQKKNAEINHKLDLFNLRQNIYSKLIELKVKQKKIDNF